MRVAALQLSQVLRDRERSDSHEDTRTLDTSGRDSRGFVRDVPTELHEPAIGHGATAIGADKKRHPESRCAELSLLRDVDRPVGGRLPEPRSGVPEFDSAIYDGGAQSYRRRRRLLLVETIYETIEHRCVMFTDQLNSAVREITRETRIVMRETCNR